MMKDSEIERLTRENERLQRQAPKDIPASTTSSHQARSGTLDSPAVDSEDDEDKPLSKALKRREGISPGAVKLNDRLRKMSKKLAVMGMIWPPELTGQAKLDHENDGFDVLEAAFNPSTPFPTTAPPSLFDAHGDNFAIFFNLLRWHIFDIFGGEFINQYSSKSWFLSDVSTLTYLRSNRLSY
jgi:hypothetical protein